MNSDIIAFCIKKKSYTKSSWMMAYFYNIGLNVAIFFHIFLLVLPNGSLCV